MEEARHSKIHRGNVRYCRRRATKKMSINQRNGGLHARREVCSPLRRSRQMVKLKAKRERKFFNDKGKSSQNIVISSDGQRTVYTTPNAGKKLNQATQKRAERSRRRTPSAKRKLVAC